MPLDQDVVNLAKAIRQHETGNRAIKGASGELASRYQYMPGTWKSTATKYLGNANAPLTLENENKATYLKILDWKKKGYNPAQIASMWNSGSPEWEGKVGVNKAGVKYDVPKYVNSVYSLYQKNKAMKPVEQPTQPAIGNPNQPAYNNDTLEQSISKTISNVPSSGWSFLKGMGELFSGITAAKSITGFVKGLVEEQTPQQNYTPPSALDVLKEAPKAAYQTLVPQAIQQLISGDLKGAKNTLVNDPIGQTVPLIAAGSLIKGKLKSTETPKIEAKPTLLKSAIEKTKTGAGQAAEFVASKATGLEPSTIQSVISKPELFTPERLSSFDRTSLADNVWKNIEKLMEEKKDTGTGYNKVRETTAVAEIPKTSIVDSLNKFNIKLDSNNQIVTSRATKPMSPADLSSIQSFIDTYIDKAGNTFLSGNEFLNAREALSNMAKYDAAKTGTAQAVSRELRSTLDSIGKAQLPELKTLDEAYAPQIKQFNQIKSDLLTKDKETGEIRFKDGSINKIANATGVGKDNLLARLEKIKPGITEDIRILKAMEDIQRTEGNKVGTYLRVVPVGAGYAAGGAIGAIFAAIMASPQVVIPMLQMFGRAMGTDSSFLNTLSGKLKAGKALTASEKEFIVDAVKFSAIINNVNNQE